MSKATRFMRSAPLQFTDENRVSGIIAPYGEITTVTDDKHPTIDGMLTYREMFVKGAFRVMIETLAKRNYFRAIPLNLDHRHDLDSLLGYAETMEERPGGVWASFALYDGPQLDKVKSMISTSHDSMSVEFGATKSRVRGNVVERVHAFVGRVAVTPIPAYKGALVESVRSFDLDDLQDEPRPDFEALKKELESLRTIRLP